MKLMGMFAAACAMIAITPQAWADGNVSGIIQSIDTRNRELVLDDGKTYTVASNVTLVGLQPGDQVTVTAERQGSTNVVSKIEQGSLQPTPPAQRPTAPKMPDE
jgi:hypothetical protein